MNELLTEKMDGVFGLIVLGDSELKQFKEYLTLIINNNKYINDNPSFNFEDDVCICSIIKEDTPSWVSGITYKLKDKVKNQTKYRVVLVKYSENEYYFEKNGGIGIKLNNFIFNPFNKSTWKRAVVLKKINVKNTFKEQIQSYLIYECTNELKTIIDNDKINEKLTDRNFEQVDLSNLDKYLKSFSKIKELSTEHKLIPYDYPKCLQIRKDKTISSETMYNKNVCENSKYILLDQKLCDGCEVADLYDKDFNLFIHNKKAEDLRCLGFQTIIGSLILKDQTKYDEYLKILNKHKINTDTIDIHTFKFCVGIIQTKQKIQYKDKIVLGIVHSQLEQMNIDFYIDKINVINEPVFEPKTKTNSKPKTKK